VILPQLHRQNFLLLQKSDNLLRHHRQKNYENRPHQQLQDIQYQAMEQIPPAPKSPDSLT
jgi:hypothetical protein